MYTKLSHIERTPFCDLIASFHESVFDNVISVTLSFVVVVILLNSAGYVGGGELGHLRHSACNMFALTCNSLALTYASALFADKYRQKMCINIGPDFGSAVLV